VKIYGLQYNRPLIKQADTKFRSIVLTAAAAAVADYQPQVAGDVDSHSVE
jgi:hypothetical protein